MTFRRASIDADDDCPRDLAPALLERARTARGDLNTAVVLAKHEYEAWFLAAAHSLRGLYGLPLDLAPPPAPESIRGAKGWLTRHMPRGRPYDEVRHQPAFTSRFDLGLAREAPSFDKCFREVVRLLTGTSPTR